MNTTQHTMNLSPEMETRIKSLKKENQTFQECCEQVMNLGLYSLEYRRDNNKVRQAKQKEERAEYKRMKAIAQTDPEIAVKLGLGTRPAL